MQHQPANSSKKITIVAFGDSITQGVAIEHECLWTTILERLLAAKYPELDITVINSGVGGNTSREGLARIEKDVLSHKPDIVLAEFGNDCTDEPHREVLPYEYVQNFSVMKKRLDEIVARLVVMSFTPIVDEWHAWLPKIKTFAKYIAAGGLDKYQEEYRNALRNFAAANNVQLIETDKAIRVEMMKKPESVIKPDGVHLTEYGNEIFAKEVFSRLVDEIS